MIITVRQFFLAIESAPDRKKQIKKFLFKSPPPPKKPRQGLATQFFIHSMGTVLLAAATQATHCPTEAGFLEGAEAQEKNLFCDHSLLRFPLAVSKSLNVTIASRQKIITFLPPREANPPTDCIDHKLYLYNATDQLFWVGVKPLKQRWAAQAAGK